MSNESEPINGATDALSIELEFDPRINFAVQQNAVPVVRLLRLTNLSGETLKDIVVTIRLEPEYANEWSSKVQMLAAGTSHTFDTVMLDLSPQKLAMLEERFGGKLRLSVISGEKPCWRRATRLNF